MRVRSTCAVIVIVVGGLTLAACSSSSKSGTDTNTTTSNSSDKSFEVNTPAGTVTLSRNGELPPNWPESFPTPSGSTPEGSGSLASDDKNVMIGLFKSPETSKDTFNFYKSNDALTVTSSSSIGISSAYLGTVKLGGDYDGGSVVVVPAGTDSAYVVITLKQAPAATTTT
jgi:hypothetical protein